MKQFLTLIVLLCSAAVFAQPANPNILFKLQGHSDDLECLAVSGNGKYIASGSWDGIVNLFGTDSNYTPLGTFSDHFSAVNCIAFTNNGKNVIELQEKIKLMFNLDENKEVLMVCNGAMGINALVGGMNIYHEKKLKFDLRGLPLFHRIIKLKKVNRRRSSKAFEKKSWESILTGVVICHSLVIKTTSCQNTIFSVGEFILKFQKVFTGT